MGGSLWRPTAILVGNRTFFNLHSAALRIKRLLIDCEAVTAKPESERALRKRYGDVCYDAFVMIQGLPKEEKWLYLGPLKRYLDERGIPRRIIPHQSEREK